MPARLWRESLQTQNCLLVAKCHKLGGFKQRQVLSYSSGGQKSAASLAGLMRTCRRAGSCWRLWGGAHIPGLGLFLHPHSQEPRLVPLL